MGRLQQLRISLPTFPKPAVVVDYSCPDACGDWAEKGDGVTVERIPGEEHFHKTRALNVGAARAIAMGAEWLFFLDSDTVVLPGFAPWVSDRLAEGKCMIVSPGEGKDGLVGLLVVSVPDFLRAGGYDESYRGWGVEDMDMRLRLRLLAGCGFEKIPDGLLVPMPHGNEMRTRHYSVKNRWISRAVNAKILESNIRSWTGKGPADLDDVSKDLLRT